MFLCFRITYLYSIISMPCNSSSLFDCHAHYSPKICRVSIACFLCFYIHLYVTSILLYIHQVEFWAQHASFIIVGVIVVTSVRGLLITLTKVSIKYHLLHCSCSGGAIYFYLPNPLSLILHPHARNRV